MFSFMLEAGFQLYMRAINMALEKRLQEINEQVRTMQKSQKSIKKGKSITKRVIPWHHRKRWQEPIELSKTT